METQRNPWSILLVDDDADSHALVRELLSQLPTPGTVLRWATDCKSAADAIRADEFDVCILGCRADAPNGLESWESTSAGRRPTIIFLSGDESYGVERQTTRIEADGYLTKDRLSASHLDRSIRHALASRRTKNELLKSKRMILAQNEVNRAILHIGDEVGLLQEICRVLVETGGYRTAWVGYARDDADRTVTVVAKHGLEEDCIPADGVTLQATGQGNPTSVSICTGGISVFRSIENDADSAPYGAGAMRPGSPAVIGFPLFSEGKTLGAITIYSSEADGFDAREIGGLRGISDILSYGIQTLRLRNERLQADKKYRSIFKNAVSGIYQTSLAGRFISLNPAFAKILKYESPEEVVNTITDISRQIYADPERRSELLRLVEEREIVEEFEARFLRKDGEIARVVLNMRAIRDGLGNIDHLEGSIWDVTARKAMEARLIRDQKLEAIGTLAGGIAHDFNNILAAIMGYTELTQQNVPDVKTRCYTQQILKACNRANNLVSQILTFSRQAELRPGPIDMAQLTGESVRLLLATLSSTIEIRTKISPEDCIVFANPIQIRQMVMNLFTNAAQAMRERGGILEVTLESVVVTSHTMSIHHGPPPGPYVKLVVRDTGTGMSPSVTNRIFDPFFTTRDRRAGTGLGLSMAYATVKECRGTIAVESERGKGSVFTVYLPAIACEIGMESKSSETTLSSNGRRIFADDGETLIKPAHEML